MARHQRIKMSRKQKKSLINNLSKAKKARIDGASVKHALCNQQVADPHIVVQCESVCDPPKPTPTILRHELMHQSFEKNEKKI